MKFYLFNGLRIEEGTHPALIKRAKERALLAYLLLHPNVPHTRDKLIEVLWSEQGSERTSRNFSNVLYRLQQWIGKKWLVVNLHSVVLQQTNDLIVDVWEFDQLWARGDPIALEQAILLYSPQLTAPVPALAPELNEGWITPLQTHYHERFLQGLRRLGEFAEQQQNIEAAVHYFHRLLHSDPLDEIAALGVMRTNLQLGRPANAVQTYEQVTATLARELRIAQSIGAIDGGTEIAGGTVTFTTKSTVTIPKLSMKGGELRGVDNFVISKEWLFGAGVVRGNGLTNTITLAEGAKMKYGGETSNATISNRKLINNGEISCPATPCSLNLNDGAWLENTDKGTFIASTGTIGGNRGEFWNSGMFTKTSSNALQISTQVSFTNDGQVYLNKGDTTFGGTYRQEAPGITLLDGGNLVGPTASSAVYFNGGQFGGNGMIDSDVVNNEALLEVGIDINTLRIKGEYQQGPLGKIKFQVGGKTPGTGHDQLLVDQALTISGTIILQAENGYSPAVNDVVVLIDSSTIIGTDHFLPATLGTHKLAYNSGEVLLMAYPNLFVSDSFGYEGAYGSSNWNFRVDLDRPVIVPIHVNYTIASGSAVISSDLVEVSGTLKIPANQTNVWFTVPVMGDTFVEPDETFTASLLNPIHATIARAQGTGTIRNDDAQAVIGAGGGQLQSTFGLGMSFPAGAVQEDTTVSAHLTQPTPTQEQMRVAATIPPANTVAFEITAKDANGAPITTFAKAFQLSFTYTDEQIAGLDEANLGLANWDSAKQQWVDVVTTVNTSSNTITASLNQPHLYAITSGQLNQIFIPIVLK